jgi:hypothetical protein
VTTARTSQLRTSDVVAAWAFYASVFGDVVIDVVPLHEQAVARGARPHWIGYLDVAKPQPGFDASAGSGPDVTSSARSEAYSNVP